MPVFAEVLKQVMRVKQESHLCAKPYKRVEARVGWRNGLKVRGLKRGWSGYFRIVAFLERMTGLKLLELDERRRLKEKRYLDMEFLEQGEYKKLWGIIEGSCHQ